LVAINVLQPNVLVIQNTSERILVSIEDDEGTAVDPVELRVAMMDLGGTEKLTDTWPTSPLPIPRLIHAGVGQFYVEIGNQSPNTETDAPYKWVFDWRAQLVLNGGYIHSIQNVNIISVRTASFLPDLRLLIDKSRKRTTTPNGGKPCYLGYSDSMLVSFLEGGLQTINAYQPSLIIPLDYYPLEFRQILIDAALITGVISQQLYALDTDIPNYNDQGTSFVITHQPQLAAFLNQISTRLDKLIPMMKLQLIQPGSLHIQMGPSFRLQTLISSAPSGALFRNMFFRA
jgi:hypothetical protein